MCLAMFVILCYTAVSKLGYTPGDLTMTSAEEGFIEVPVDDLWPSADLAKGAKKAIVSKLPSVPLPSLSRGGGEMEVSYGRGIEGRSPYITCFTTPIRTTTRWSSC